MTCHGKEIRRPSAMFAFRGLVNYQTASGRDSHNVIYCAPTLLSPSLSIGSDGHAISTAQALGLFFMHGRAK